MKFFYSPSVSPDPDSKDYLLILRPEIPVTVSGPVGSMAYGALVDTGSDNTILPLSIADFLSIPVKPAAGLPAKVFSGERVQLFLGEVTFRLSDGEEAVLW